MPTILKWTNAFPKEFYRIGSGAIWKKLPSVKHDAVLVIKPEKNEKKRWKGDAIFVGENCKNSFSGQ